MPTTLSGKLPEPDANGLYDQIAKLTEEFEQGSKRVVPVLALVKVTSVKLNEDDSKTTTLRIARIEAVLPDDQSVAHRLLERSWESRRGVETLPYDLETDVNKAFAGLDDDEIRRDAMTDADEIREHLKIIHGRPDAGALTDDGAVKSHLRDHEDAHINHPTGWMGWTRRDLEEAEWTGGQARTEHLATDATVLLHWADGGWRLTANGALMLPPNDTIASTDGVGACVWAEQAIKLGGRHLLRWADYPDLPGARRALLDDTER